MWIDVWMCFNSVSKGVLSMRRVYMGAMLMVVGLVAGSVSTASEVH